MTIALGKFTKDENDLFDIMDDWLRRDRFVFVLKLWTKPSPWKWRRRGRRRRRGKWQWRWCWKLKYLVMTKGL